MQESQQIQGIIAVTESAAKIHTFSTVGLGPGTGPLHPECSRTQYWQVLQRMLTPRTRPVRCHGRPSHRNGPAPHLAWVIPPPGLERNGRSLPLLLTRSSAQQPIPRHSTLALLNHAPDHPSHPSHPSHHSTFPPSHIPTFPYSHTYTLPHFHPRTPPPTPSRGYPITFP